MPAYNFQPRFAPLILSGSKCSTIRGREAKAGSTAYLFTGMRTKSCQRLGQGEILNCSPILLAYDRHSDEPVIILRASYLDVAHQNHLATEDGFASIREMLAWFKKTYDTAEPKYTEIGNKIVFDGFLITWGAL